MLLGPTPDLFFGGGSDMGVKFPRLGKYGSSSAWRNVDRADHLSGTNVYITDQAQPLDQRA